MIVCKGGGYEPCKDERDFENLRKLILWQYPLFSNEQPSLAFCYNILGLSIHLAKDQEFKIFWKESKFFKLHEKAQIKCQSKLKLKFKRNSNMPYNMNGSHLIRINKISALLRGKQWMGSFKRQFPSAGSKVDVKWKLDFDFLFSW